MKPLVNDHLFRERSLFMAGEGWGWWGGGGGGIDWRKKYPPCREYVGKISPLTFASSPSV